MTSLPAVVPPPSKAVPRAKVLVVDDDRVVLKAAAEILKREGFLVTAIDDAVEGLAAAKDPSFDVAVLDINMPNLTGMDLLRAIKQDRPELEVIMMTAYGTVETAVQAVKAGAYDYLTKPFENIDDLTLTVTKAAERRLLRHRARQLEEELSVRDSFEELVGQSAQMRAVFKLVETVSHSTATVLIQGESGTGKELVARAIHYRSPRKDKPFVAINCSALTETLLESELFGHVKGAFTGALSNKQGLFEAANGGTIFLDEVGDLPHSTQVRLLRVLQEGEVRPVGSNQTIKVDARVLAATNVDLIKAKEQGKFREDLFYRLNVIPVRLPPLRERPDDVPLLVGHFLQEHSRRSERKAKGISREAMEALTCYRWPGNVRELENVMERVVVLTPGEMIGAEDLPPELSAPQRNAADLEVYSLAHLPYAEAKRLALRAFERRYLAASLERNQGSVSLAARAAGIDRSNFRRLLKQYEVGELRKKPEGAGAATTEPAAEADDADDAGGGAEG